MATTKTTATTVATGLMRNMTPAQPSAPRSDRAQWTLKRGRNEGLPRKRSTPAVTFSTP